MAALIALTGAHASTDEWVGSPLHSKILLRALSYDRSLQGDELGPLRIGVLTVEGDEASAAQGVALGETLREYADLHTFWGRSILVEDIPVALSADEAVPLPDGIDALYLVPGLSDRDLEWVLADTRSREIVTLCAVEWYVRYGVSLAVTVHEDRPQILINLGSSRAEGADFSAQLLQLAVVLDTEAGEEEGSEIGP